MVILKLLRCVRWLLRNLLRIRGGINLIHFGAMNIISLFCFIGALLIFLSSLWRELEAACESVVDR